jgi:hypothetical protein
MVGIFSLRCQVQECKWRKDVPKHVSCYYNNTTPSGLAWLPGRLLQPCLDSINRRIGERTHSTRDQTDDCSLPGWERCVMVLWLPFLENFLEFCVGGKVYSLICA